MKTPVILHVLL